MYQLLMILLHRPWYLRHDIDQNTSLNDAAYRRCNVAASRIVSLLGVSFFRFLGAENSS